MVLTYTKYKSIYILKDYIPQELFQLWTQMYTNTGIYTFPPEINLQSSEWVGTREHKNSKLLLSLFLLLLTFLTKSRFHHCIPGSKSLTK